MNYIWDIALKAEQSGIDRDQLFFKQAEYCSPWYEQAFSSLNEKELEGTTVEINARYRFDAMFNRLLDPDETTEVAFRTYLYDLAIHFLCELDFYQGLTREEFYIRHLSREISSGMLGKQAAQCYTSLPFRLKRELACLMLCQVKTGPSLPLFRRAVTTTFPTAILYQIRREPEQLLLYLELKKNRQREQWVQLISDLFLPLGYHIRLFWAHHFGVLGVDATMQMEETEIF